MKKIMKITALVIGSVLCLGGGVLDASATKYTTRDSKSSQQKNSRNSKSQKKTVSCTDDHKYAIRSFNDKAMEKKEEFEDLLAGKDQVDTAREAKEFTKKLEKLQDFYNSQEFSLMEEIYALCDEDLPRPKEELPFFLPEDLGIGDEVDAI